MFKILILLALFGASFSTTEGANIAREDAETTTEFIIWEIRTPKKPLDEDDVETTTEFWIPEIITPKKSPDDDDNASTTPEPKGGDPSVFVCGAHNVTLLVSSKTQDATLFRLCVNNSEIIDFNKSIQNVTIFRGFSNHKFFEDPNYGEKFILQTITDGNVRSDPVTIVPGFVDALTVTGINFAKVTLIARSGPAKIGFVDAFTHPLNPHMKTEKIRLYPGWEGQLLNSTHQLMVPEPDSSYLPANVTVVPEYQNPLVDNSIRANVNGQIVTILFED